MFNPGDTVSSHEGWQLQVEEVKEENGLLTYIGTRRTPVKAAWRCAKSCWTAS